LAESSICFQRQIVVFNFFKHKLHQMQVNAINLKLYDFARQKLSLSESDAKEFGITIEEVIETEKGELATKDFVKKELAETKNEVLKWFVGLFISLALMVIGLYFK
jgi:hypothetical protein